MFLLVGCVETVAIFGGATNGKIVQSSLQTAASYGIKKRTGKTPLGHALGYVKKENQKLNKPCPSVRSKKDLEVCLRSKEKIAFKPSKELALSLQLSINENSKIKYLD